jgi:hypothetical protein
MKPPQMALKTMKKKLMNKAADVVQTRMRYVLLRRAAIRNSLPTMGRKYMVLYDAVMGGAAGAAAGR